MEITNKNFREKLTELDEVIKEATCFSIDCEFTGISTENNIFPYDSPQNAYKKISENSAGYIIIQLGLTALRPCPKNPDKFLYRSYNFYVFPQYWKHSFLCQGSSMNFLAENNFDFNKLFKEGISFCNHQEEKILREKLKEKHKKREEKLNENNCNNHIPIPEEEKETIANIRKNIEDFLNSEDTEKTITDCNPFQRKLVYEMIELQFSDKISASTKTVDNLKVILIERKKSKDVEQEIENERQLNDLFELEDMIGIATIMQKISKSKKVIIGHNMLLDLIYIIRQFFGPLSDDLQEFKKIVHNIFPYVVDTKYMCTLEKLKSKIKDTSLGPLVNILREKPFTMPVLECETESHFYKLEDCKLHEAGYDSYLTALAFVGLVNHLGIDPKDVFGNSQLLKNFINRIFLMRIQDVGYINLNGIEPTPRRDHVFHVVVPEMWRQSDLVNHFKNYGPILISWINSTSALISLHNRENSSVVLKTIGKYPGFQVKSYREFEKCLQNQKYLTDGTTSIKRKHECEQATQSVERNHNTKKFKQSSQVRNEEKEKLKKVFVGEDDWS